LPYTSRSALPCHRHSPKVAIRFLGKSDVPQYRWFFADDGLYGVLRVE
jgi:hypothetical protein